MGLVLLKRSVLQARKFYPFSFRTILKILIKNNFLFLNKKTEFRKIMIKIIVIVLVLYSVCVICKGRSDQKALEKRLNRSPLTTMATSSASCVQSTYMYDQVSIGLYLDSIYNIDMLENSVEVAVDLWFKVDQVNAIPRPLPYDPGVSLTIHDVLDYQAYNLTMNSLNGTQFLYGTIFTYFTIFNLKYYPFDTQVFKFVIEDAIYSIAYLQLIADDEPNTGYNTRRSQSSGWEIEKILLREETYSYDSNFGGITCNQFSRVNAYLVLRRTDSYIFVNMIVPPIFIVIVVLMGFLLPANSIAVKINLVLISMLNIFVITSNYIFANINVQTNANFTTSLGFIIEMLTLAAIIISFILFVFIYMLDRTHKIKPIEKKLMFYPIVCIGGVYFFCLLVICSYYATEGQKSLTNSEIISMGDI